MPESIFRTVSGQTGPTAWEYEAAQIANAQRELDARAARLSDIMQREVPEDACVKFSIATPRFPEAVTYGDAESVRNMLNIIRLARDGEYLARIARGVRDPEFVVKHPD